MRTIIISDIHHRTNWIEECLDKEKWDEAVFLGDYFDNFHDGAHLAERTAKWLKNQLDLKKKYDIQNIHYLIGNHDQYYCFPFKWDYISAGFTHEKNRVIRQILHPEDWKGLELYNITQENFLLSHAGFNRGFYDHAIPPTLRKIKTICDKARKDLENGYPNPILAVGRDKCGNDAPQDIGGITWQDWGSFREIPNVNQIVGHTSGGMIRRLVTPHSRNYCIDTSNRTVCFLENGHLIVKDNKYL